jgi:hypothetical protein
MITDEEGFGAMVSKNGVPLHHHHHLSLSLSLSLSPQVQDKIFGGMLQGHDCRSVQTFRGLIIKLVCCCPPPLLLPATYLLQPDPSSSKRPEAGAGAGGGRGLRKYLQNLYSN